MTEIISRGEDDEGFHIHFSRGEENWKQLPQTCKLKDLFLCQNSVHLTLFSDELH